MRNQANNINFISSKLLLPIFSKCLLLYAESNQKIISADHAFHNTYDSVGKQENPSCDLHTRFVCIV